MNPKPFTYTKLKQKWRNAAEQRRQEAATAKETLVKEGKPIFQKYSIRKAAIFGSLVEHRFERRSDIDLYVEPLSNDHYWEFEHELEEALGFPIDLYTDKDDKHFIRKILSRGEVIHEI